MAGSVVGHGVGHSAAGFSVNVSASTIAAKQQTILSQRVAPPPPRGASRLLAFAMFVLWFISFAIALGPVGAGGSILIASIIAAFVFYFADKKRRAWNATEHPRLMKEWGAKLLCRRCGEFFIPQAYIAK
jgi:hypothetical protein